jgi:hypothetical protein
MVPSPGVLTYCKGLASSASVRRNQFHSGEWSPPDLNIPLELYQPTTIALGLGFLHKILEKRAFRSISKRVYQSDTD